MADIVDKQTRSRMMSEIRGKNTQPEMKVRRYLHACGFRYRLHVRTLPGTPDICLPKYQTVIFVQGCFWHRHKGCRLSYMPASNKIAWQTKFQQNVMRDRKNTKALIQNGWRVIVLWECGLRKSGESLLKWLPPEIQFGNEQLVEWPREVKRK
ncbi:very short patch repair endonuclease [Sideroxyarcus emersonii]|uniref:very short patch repair endonuclease n=1 Tax=Sideroxyarcus emersonii TaxID=2764705 RepID=UPI001F0097BB|nr:DNA mismatch endonuclease Vsr [Sideroxyarcus emersonii]